ncbi:MAG: hypothetical protein IKL32_07040 [Alphaproteobacteria bacterium]|nr:hypothetical protein [Alphaproteobacteria bacterium]
MQNNKLDSGRSMVEMLGTLVVIGILSIGSIMGYSYAIDKYKANETLNELQIRVLDWSQQVINGATELSSTEMGDKTSLGYPIEAQISPLYEDYFEVFLDEVPSSVCHHLVQSGWTLPFSIFIGLEEYETNPEICDKNDKVTLAYEFKNDLTPKEAIPEEDRHKTFRCKNDNDCKCGTCTEGLCVSICPQGASCAIDFDNASSYVCCLKEFTVGNLCCNSVDANGHCCKSNGVCCPENAPILGADGKCYSCDTQKGINVYGMTENCNVCSNRVVSQQGYCGLKCGIKGTITEDKPLKGTDGGCYACDEPKTISSDNCSVCPNRFTGTTYDSPNQNCYACGIPGTTVENKPLGGLYGTCYSCDEANPVLLGVNSAGHKCEDVCPNRTSDGDRSGYGNHYCSKGVCTADKPIMTSGGVCADCAYGKAVFLESVFGGCETACPNRKVVDNLCVLETCPEDKPLKGTDGGCYACDEPKTISSDNCSVCPNRFTGTTYDSPNQNCYACGTPGTTVENKPIAGWWGTCYSCEELETITTGVSTEEFRCETVCPNREADGYSYGNPICKRTSCPEDKQLEDKNGACHACNTSVGIDVNGDNTKCEKCLNRKLDGDYCVLSE